MTNSNYNTTKRAFSHLSDTQRGKLEILAKEGRYTQAQMAKIIGVNQSTISRELKRGRTRQMNSERTFYHVYLADVGVRVYHENRKHSRPKDHRKYSKTFFKELEKAIVTNDKQPRIHSVDTFVHTYQRKHSDERIPCTKTVYNLIDQGVLSIRNIDLPMKTKLRARKQKTSEPKGSNKKKLGRSIDERDPAVLSREESGHWEVDLMIGKKAKTEPVILTMVERKTRILLTKKVWGQSAEIIQKATLQLMESHGLEHFQSLTTDNGSEFSTLSLIEEDIPGLEVFFTHAYAAWEKGTNERHNGLLREFIAKGESLRSLTYHNLKKYTDVINQRPRRILNYETPLEAFDKEQKLVKSA